MNESEKLAYNRQWKREHKESLKEANRHWRETHKEYIHEYNIAYNKTHSELIRNLRERYRSVRKHYKQKKYPYNPEAERERRQKAHRKIKREVLTHYGNGILTCMICGVDNVDCLSIDHINGGGTKHRKELGLSGIKFYWWLKRQGLPDGYRTLCMNCQFIERKRTRRE